MWDRLTTWPLDAPRTAYALAVALALLAVWPLTRVTLVTDPAGALRSSSARALQRVRRLYGVEDRAFLLLEADRPGREADLRRLAEQIARGLAGHSQVRGVRYGEPARELPARIDSSWLLYWEGPALARLLSERGMREQLARQLARLSLPGLGPADRWVARDPLGLHRPLLKRLAGFSGGQRFRRGSLEHFSEDGRALLVTIVAARPASDMVAARELVLAIRRAVRAAAGQPWAAGLTADLTGGHSLAEESERVIRGDLIRSLSASVLLAALLLAVGLRLPASQVGLLCLPTLWGTLVGIGMFCAASARLSALSLGCSAILIGLGVDFTIHLAATAIVERERGRAAREAVLEAVRQTRGRLLLAALTSTAAFAAFQASDQLFLRQMGQLTVSGILACLVGALLLLPPLLVRMLSGPAGPLRTFGAVRLARLAAGRPLLVAATTLLLSLTAGVAVARAPEPFENDLRRIHARDSVPLRTQRRIAERFGGSAEPVLLLVEAADARAVVAACQRLEGPLTELAERGLLVGHASVAALLPRPEVQRSALSALAGTDPRAVARRLEGALDRVGFDAKALAGYVGDLERALARREPVAAGPGTDRFLRADGGRHLALVILHPREAPWSAAHRRELVTALESALSRAGARGELTGLLLVSAESARQVRRDFGEVLLFTLCAVLLVLLCRFRRPGRVLLVLLPAGLGALWTAGLLTALQLKLNLMNLGVLPMVLAIGVDDGIHLVAHRLEQPGADTAGIYRATGTAVVLTSVTTMVTFGSLALSANQGLASVGLLSLCGMGACLLASLWVLPPLLEPR